MRRYRPRLVRDHGDAAMIVRAVLIACAAIALTIGCETPFDPQNPTPSPNPSSDPNEVTTPSITAGVYRGDLALSLVLNLNGEAIADLEDTPADVVAFGINGLPLTDDGTDYHVGYTFTDMVQDMTTSVTVTAVRLVPTGVIIQSDVTILLAINDVTLAMTGTSMTVYTAVSDTEIEKSDDLFVIAQDGENNLTLHSTRTGQLER